MRKSGIRFTKFNEERCAKGAVKVSNDRRKIANSGTKKDQSHVLAVSDYPCTNNSIYKWGVKVHKVCSGYIGGYIKLYTLISPPP